METRPAVLIFDAECPVCRKAAGWVRDHAASPGLFEFLPCRSEETAERFPSIGEDECLSAIHLVLSDGAVLAGERALPEILRRIPRWRILAALLRLPGAGFLSHALYRGFAAHRYRISGAFARKGK